jgi:ABC-type transport system involved in multi-copper enzyme maturation permease subunit
MTVRAIASNTFREAIRDRILYLLLFFAVAALAFSRLLALLSVGDRAKVIMDVGLGSLSLFGTLMAVLMGTGLVFKEIDKRTIYTLLAKPLHRWQFLLGKFIGLVLTLMVMLGIMSLVFLILILAHSGRIAWEMFAGLGFIFLELCLITAVSLFFSCFSTPILSSVFSLSFYLIGHLSWGLDTLIGKLRPGLGKTAVRIAYTLLPDLENFNFKTEIVHHLPITAGVMLSSLAYGILYTCFVLAAAVLVFRRRDFI